MISAFANAFRIPELKNRIIFTLWMCVTTVFAINLELSWVQLNKVLKIQLMTLVAMIALREDIKVKEVSMSHFLNLL